MMKKIFLLAAFAASTLGFAQDISIGAKAGLNLASVTGDNTDNSEMLIGYHVGGVLELKLTDFISLQPELLFSTQGAKNEFNIEALGSKTETKTTANLNYLNIPIMGKFYIAEGLGLEAGPQLGFLMSAKQKGETTITIKDQKPTTSSVEGDIKEGYNGFDFGFGAGLTYKLDSGLTVGGRYVFGLSDINKAENSKNGNGVIQISVGYFFK